MKIEASHENPHNPEEVREVKGIVKALGEGQFTISVRRIRNGMPPLSELTVRYAEQTRWHIEDSPASPESIQPGIEVEVKGTYDSGSQVLNALVIELDD